MTHSHQTSPIFEVDFDTCMSEPVRSRGSAPGSDLLPGERLRCVTHGLSLVQGRLNYFNAQQKCDLVALGSPGRRARRATRVTRHLSADDVTRLYLAIMRANLQDMHLTYFATISWSTLGLTDDAEIQVATQALFERLREWAKRKKDARGAPAPIPLAWIWVHERGPRLGMHTHLLMHVPIGRSAGLGKVICNFLESWSGQALVNEGPGGLSTFHAREPRRYGQSILTRHAVAFQKSVARYMMKGLDPVSMVPPAAGRQTGRYLRAVLRLKKIRDQGHIQGKRCGYSVHNLGKAAFARASDHTSMKADQAERLLRAHGFNFDDLSTQACNARFSLDALKIGSLKNLY